MLTEEGDRYRAVTYNNFACIFRRTKKLRSVLTYLEKALEIEYNYLPITIKIEGDHENWMLDLPEELKEYTKVITSMLGYTRKIKDHP